MELKKLFWLADESASNTFADTQDGFEDIELRKVTTIDELMAEIGKADCVLASVPLSEADVDSIAPVPVIFRLDQFTPADVVRMMRAGAFHCFDGTASIDEVRAVVSAAIEQSASGAANRAPSHQTEKWRATLVGKSNPMEIVAEMICLIAARKCTVLISGETGTGKEMAARAIHMASPRAGYQMVAVNCTALPENLLEAELFGHTRGAFTGATSHRVGRFEQAHKSTLFLDEIGDMPLELQAKLLRVLQDREFQRLGSSETIKVDVRVIAASNVDLTERVREGKFRADLYYRLNVVPLVMPPLRERKEDIPALVNHFVDKVCRSENIARKQVASGALESLCRQPWPGNIRQLENTIEMGIALSGDREFLTSQDFCLRALPVRERISEMVAPEPVQHAPAADFDTAISRFEFELLTGALRESDGNKTIAAERLGIKRTTFIMKLKNLEKTHLSSSDVRVLPKREQSFAEIRKLTAA